jgi:hypothetical protein
MNGYMRVLFPRKKRNRIILSRNDDCSDKQRRKREKKREEFSMYVYIGLMMDILRGMEKE